MAKAKTTKPETVETETVKVEVPKFTKQKLMGSERFMTKHIKYVDLLNVLLKDGETYSLAEVEQLVSDFFNNKTK